MADVYKSKARDELVCRPSPIDHKRGSRHECGVIRCKKECGFGNLFGGSNQTSFLL